LHDESEYRGKQIAKDMKKLNFISNLNKMLNVENSFNNIDKHELF